MSFSHRTWIVGRKNPLIALFSIIVLVSSFMGIFGNTTVSAQTSLRGYLDQVTGVNGGQSVTVAGWACAPQEPNRILRIDVYNVGLSNGQITPDTYVGSLQANKQRESAVGDQCGGNRNHGFSGTLNGVCLGRNTPHMANLRVFAVYSDSPPVNIGLTGASTVFPAFCPKA